MPRKYQLGRWWRASEPRGLGGTGVCSVSPQGDLRAPVPQALRSTQESAVSVTVEGCGLRRPAMALVLLYLFVIPG